MIGPLERVVERARRARRWAHRAGLLASHPVQAPVISVGARGLGGQGKTPVTGFLALELLSRGFKVAVLMGGYRGGNRDGPGVVPPHAGDRAGAVRRFGDEALLMACWAPGALVIAGKDRLAAARLATARGADLILVDDGYTHRRLARDLDLVLCDPSQDRARPPAGQGALPWAHTRDGSLAPPMPPGWITSRLRPNRLLGMDGADLGRAEDLAGKRVYLAAGIARPSALERMVRGLGARVVGRSFCRDHNALPASALTRARRRGAELLLGSEKDLVRMAGQDRWRELVALTCQVELCQGEGLLRGAVAGVTG